eukprot:762514-Hanusia_phi.AAC.7
MVAALMLISVLAETAWSTSVLNRPRVEPFLSRLLRLLPKTKREVNAMHPTSGVIAKWNEHTLLHYAHMLAKNPEASMASVGECVESSFQKLRCIVLVDEVLEVMEKLMLKMTEIRFFFFTIGAAQSLIMLHLYSKLRNVQETCLKLACLMAANEKLSHIISNNKKYLDIIDFALRLEGNPVLPRTAMISICELSKNFRFIDMLAQRGLVQALEILTDTHDPLQQALILQIMKNLSKTISVKEQVVRMNSWPRIVRWLDSFDPAVRNAANNLLIEFATGEDNRNCREALAEVAKEVKNLQGASRVNQEVLSRFIDYVNQSDQIIKAQAWIRGVMGRKKAQLLRVVKKKEKKGNTSVVIKAIAALGQEASSSAYTNTTNHLDHQ